MLNKQDFRQFGANLIYMKRVRTADLPVELQAEAGEFETLFSLHNARGEQVALVANPAVASHLAAENRMQLVTLH